MRVILVARARARARYRNPNLNRLNEVSDYEYIYNVFKPIDDNRRNGDGSPPFRRLYSS